MHFLTHYSDLNTFVTGQATVLKSYLNHENMQLVF